MTTAIHSMPELLAALRARRDELQLTHETIDHIAGWPSGYCGKLLAQNPIKNLGWQSLGLALDTLAIELIPAENIEQRKLLEKRWKARERPKNGIEQASRAGIPGKPIWRSLEFMKMLSKRGASKGGKRRAKLMSKRARQRAASHAARIRWSKAK